MTIEALVKRACKGIKMFFTHAQMDELKEAKEEFEALWDVFKELGERWEAAQSVKEADLTREAVIVFFVLREEITPGAIEGAKNAIAKSANAEFPELIDFYKMGHMAFKEIPTWDL